MRAGFPDEWVSSFAGYASEPLGDTPTEARENRTDSFSSSGEPDFGSREWLQDFLTDDDGELRFVGTRLADVLDGALAWSADAEVNPVIAFVFCPATSLSPTVRRRLSLTSSGTRRNGASAPVRRSRRVGRPVSPPNHGSEYMLRHRGGDDDRERNMEVAETNLDMAGWAVGSEGVERDYQLGMPEVPAVIRRFLNGLLGLSGADVAWYRTGGVEISCLWGGFYQTNLVASAQARWWTARAKSWRTALGSWSDVQEALGASWLRPSSGCPDLVRWYAQSQNHAPRCSGDGFAIFSTSGSSSTSRRPASATRRLSVT